MRYAGLSPIYLVPRQQAPFWMRAATFVGGIALGLLIAFGILIAYGVTAGRDHQRVHRLRVPRPERPRPGRDRVDAVGARRPRVGGGAQAQVLEHRRRGPDVVGLHRRDRRRPLRHRPRFLPPAAHVHRRRHRRRLLDRHSRLSQAPLPGQRDHHLAAAHLRRLSAGPAPAVRPVARPRQRLSQLAAL